MTTKERGGARLTIVQLVITKKITCIKGLLILSKLEDRGEIHA